MPTLPTKTIHVVIVDDHRVVREGLRILLDAMADIKVVGEAGSAEELARSDFISLADVVVMDLHMPGDNGIVTARSLLAEHPELRVIMLTSTAEPSEILEAISAGAVGYIVKENAWEDLGRAIHAVLAGKMFFCPDSVTAAFRHRLSPPSAPPMEKEDLAERDVQILKLVAEGRRNKEIAEQLGLTVKSVETYRSRLMEKLGCQSPADLVRFAIRRGLVQA